MSDNNLRRLFARPEDSEYVLRLYVAGSTPRSSRAITNLKTICETHLKDRYALTVVDLYEEKERAQDDDIEVAPTLIRQSPLPVRRLPVRLRCSSASPRSAPSSSPQVLVPG